jgi:DNA-binding phage protein
MNIPGAYQIFLIEGGKSARDVIVELGEKRDTMRKALSSKNPTIKTLAKYCKPLDIKVSELIAKAEQLGE